MDSKMQESFWFGCDDCQYEPSKDEKASNENWNVYDYGKCPKCGKQMDIHVRQPEIYLRTNETT